MRNRAQMPRNLQASPRTALRIPYITCIRHVFVYFAQINFDKLYMLHMVSPEKTFFIQKKY